MKGISKEDFPNNFLGESSNRSLRMRTMTVSERYPAIRPRVVQYIYRILVVSFREQKAFVLKTMILLAFDLGMCEGVGENSGHGIGQVDIRVGSYNCLDVIVFHDMCT